MFAPQHLQRRFPTIIERMGRRPLLAGAALASLLGGFIAAAMVDQQASRWIRAEGEPAEYGQAAEIQSSLLQPDPNVWPILKQTFPTNLNLLAPEPLLTPVPSLDHPLRFQTSVLRAALNAAATPSSHENETVGGRIAPALIDDKTPLEEKSSAPAE